MSRRRAARRRPRANPRLESQSFGKPAHERAEKLNPRRRALLRVELDSNDILVPDGRGKPVVFVNAPGGNAVRVLGTANVAVGVVGNWRQWCRVRIHSVPSHLRYPARFQLGDRALEDPQTFPRSLFAGLKKKLHP